MDLQRDWLAEAVPAAQQRAPQCQEANVGLHMTPESLKEQDFTTERGTFKEEK